MGTLCGDCLLDGLLQYRAWGSPGSYPDLVPPSQRGRYLGIKAFFELPLPLIFVAFTISRMVTAGNLWGAILAMIAVFVVATVLTMMVRETPLKQPTKPMDWTGILRLVAMTGLFTLVIVLVGTGCAGCCRISALKVLYPWYS